MEKKVAKIIFLDFDGVLNTEYHQRQLQFEGKIVNEKNLILLINENETFEFSIGTVISLLPIGGDVEEINISGFEYPIVNGRMTMKNPYGISNVVTQQEQKISFAKGMLLVIISED